MTTAPQIAALRERSLDVGLLRCALVEAGLGVSLAPASIRRIRLERVVFRALKGCDVRTRVAAGWRRDNCNPLLAQLASLFDEDASGTA